MSPDQAQSLLAWVGTGLFHATLLALLTWLLTSTLLRRCRPGLKALLWMVVLFKFLLPPVLPLPGEVAFSHWVSQIEVRESLSRLSMSEGEPLPRQAVPFQEPAGKLTPQRTQESSTWWSFLLTAYFLGVSALALRAGISALRFRRWLVRLPAAEGRLAEQVGQAARRLKLRRVPQVCLSEDATSPLVAGLLRPHLVLPRRLLDHLEPRAREALIIHELAHIRRGDLWLRALRNLARLLLFFWPPLWWVCRRLERSAEMACDHWALALSGVSPSTYARTLLLAAKTAGAPSPGLRQLAFASRRRPLEERFDMILKQKDWTLPRISWLSLLLLAAWTAFAWAGSAAGPEQEQEKEKPRSILVAQQSAEQGAKARFRLRETSAQAMIELAEAHPEADLDGDGNLSKEEVAHHFAEQRRMRKMEVMRDFPEADLNYDGQLSDQELKVFDMEQQVLEAKESLRDNPDFPVVFRSMRIPSAGPWLTLTGNQAVYRGADGVYVVGQEGANFTITERSPAGRGMVESRASLEKLLKEHPEADLDGDGHISAQEAKALVAKLQEGARFLRLKEKKEND
ncbi:MAG TPA: M56 family metallopeptidase [Acidobacteriota bacterium]|nr:M56 family metallopeptidase [Acidobacteriota bacterium]